VGRTSGFVEQLLPALLEMLPEVRELLDRERLGARRSISRHDRRSYQARFAKKRSLEPSLEPSCTADRPSQGLDHSSRIVGVENRTHHGDPSGPVRQNRSDPLHRDATDRDHRDLRRSRDRGKPRETLGFAIAALARRLEDRAKIT